MKRLLALLATVLVVGLVAGARVSSAAMIESGQTFQQEHLETGVTKRIDGTGKNPVVSRVEVFVQGEPVHVSQSLGRGRDVGADVIPGPNGLNVRFKYANRHRSRGFTLEGTVAAVSADGRVLGVVSAKRGLKPRGWDRTKRATAEDFLPIANLDEVAYIVVVAGRRTSDRFVPEAIEDMDDFMRVIAPAL